MMPMSRDNRISVQASCPHGVFADGSRRWKLTQHRPVGEIETYFSSLTPGLDVREAVWEIEGVRATWDEVNRGKWKLERIHEPYFASIGGRFRDLVKWHNPRETAAVCDLCAIDAVRRAEQ